jgi:hypothetical protein
MADADYAELLPGEQTSLLFAAFDDSEISKAQHAKQSQNQVKNLYQATVGQATK